MVKNAKLWREISLQYQRLAELEGAGASQASEAPAAESSVAARAAGAESGAERPPAVGGGSAFYRDGLRQRHWVLFLCAMMTMCEWMDRSVLSISMESIKAEFALSDRQVGMIASSSLWMVPFAMPFMGRLSDYLPKATLLGFSVLGWAGCTLATGGAWSFNTLILSRLLAGVSNCAGYPVAVSLLGEFFAEQEMTTALGYFNAGNAIGGLMGLGFGGLVITQLGWRWAFWGVASPQVLVAILLLTTVRNNRQPRPKQSWAKDLWQLLQLPTLRLFMASAFLSGLMSGNQRFISALVERVYRVDAQTIGLVLGVVLGSTGVVASWSGGHAVDHVFRRTQDRRVLLWCAAAGDVLHLLFGTGALLAPSFGLCVLGLACTTCASSLGQGVDTGIQALAVGRRGTTQAFLELCWSLGMAVGPFLGGIVSDSFAQLTCDPGCALSQSLLIIGGIGLALRAFCYLMAASHFQEDAELVALEMAAPLTACPEAAAAEPPGAVDAGSSASKTDAALTLAPGKGYAAEDTDGAPAMELEMPPWPHASDRKRSAEVDPPPGEAEGATVFGRSCAE